MVPNIAVTSSLSGIRVVSKYIFQNKTLNMVPVSLPLRNQILFLPSITRYKPQSPRGNDLS